MTAKITNNGLIKYYDQFNRYIWTGFYFKNARKILKKEGYKVISLEPYNYAL